MEDIGHEREQQGEYYEHNKHHLVLLLEIRHRALAHILGDLFHRGSSFALFFHLVVEEPGEKQRQQ